MRYLITGINGFVGPHLANLLYEEGHDVAGLIRETNGTENDIRDVVKDSVFSKIDFFYGDIINSERMENLFKDQEFDGVFHLAAQSHPPTSFEMPVETFKINALGTINIARAIEKYQKDCRMMFCSTSEVYGAVPEKKGFIDETFPIEPVNPYGVSKAAADLYVRERAKSLGLNFFVTRAFSHTGPRRGRIFSISSDAYQIARILKGMQKKVINVGTLSSKRVVIDVRDCVKAYYLLMQKFKSGEAYNVGGNVLYSMGDFLEKMLELSDLRGKVELKLDKKLVRPIDIPVQVCNSEKIRLLTNWKPEIKLDKTLTDLLDYWMEKIK